MRDPALGVGSRGADIAPQPVVEEANAPVRAQQVVAGMRVAQRDPIAVQETEVEAEDDLPVAIALWLGEPANRLKTARPRCTRTPAPGGSRARC